MNNDDYIPEPRSGLRQVLKFDMRLVLDSVFVTFIVATVFYGGEKVNFLDSVNERVVALTDLKIDARLTALDVQSQSAAEQLKLINAKQDSLIELVSRLSANVQDDRRYGSTLPPSARRN